MKAATPADRVVVAITLWDRVNGTGMAAKKK
jgi:hypothetical protein